MKMKSSRVERCFVVCLNADAYPASLVARKIYELLPDPLARKRGLLRVIDESGEDYLYPEELFAAIDVPAAANKVFSPSQ